jgi:hypothetical protein
MSEDLRRRVKEALERIDIMALSTIGPDGPWTAPVQYRYNEKLDLFFLSMPGTKHVRDIERPARLCCQLQPPWAARRESRLADKRDSRASDQRVFCQRMAKFQDQAAGNLVLRLSCLRQRTAAGGYIGSEPLTANCLRTGSSAHAVNADDTETT